jgi:hypothetical protein
VRRVPSAFVVGAVQLKVTDAPSTRAAPTTMLTRMNPTRTNQECDLGVVRIREARALARAPMLLQEQEQPGEGFFMFGPLWAPPISGGGPWGGQRRLRDNGGLPRRKRGCVPAVRCHHDCDGALSSNECHCCEEDRQSDDRELASGTHVRNLAKLRGTDAAGPIGETFDLPQFLPDSRAGQVGLKAYVGPRAGQVGLGVTDGVYGPEDFSGVVVRRADGAVGLSPARSYSTGTA